MRFLSINCPIQKVIPCYLNFVSALVDIFLGPLDTDIFVEYIKAISPITVDMTQRPKRITILTKKVETVKIKDENQERSSASIFTMNLVAFKCITPLLLIFFKLY